MVIHTSLRKLVDEVKIFLAGIILALFVLYEAFVVYRHEKIVSQLPELIKEFPAADRGRQ